MGKASGIGMGPAFQVFRPFVSPRISKAEAAEQRKLEEDSATVSYKLHRLAEVHPRMAKLVNEARAKGKGWLEIAETLADVIREAERREAVKLANK